MRKLYQIQAKKCSINEVCISFLPCSCLKCRANPSNISEYLYKSIRNTQIREIEQRLSNDVEEVGLFNLTARKLKDICRICGQPAGGNKHEIITRLTEFLSALLKVNTNADSHLKKKIPNRA